MKKMLTNNLGLKLLSLLCAAMLWLIVVNMDESYSYQTYSPIPVTMLNEDVVTDQGKVYKIEDNSDVISVRVWARRTVHEELSASDFTATADLKKNIKMDGSLVGIEVTCSNKNVKAEDIIKSRENVVISIEDGSTEQFNVVVKTEGSTANGYVVGTAVPEQGLIEVSGPSSVISEIKRVEVQIDTTGINSDRTLHGELKFYDSSDREVDTTYLEYTGKNEGMDVEVTVLRTKTVALKVGHSGTPADGYSFSSISYKPETVEIAGSSDTIRNITSITIPDEAVSIEGISENLQTTIDLTQYLPDGVRLADANDSSVAVVVEIEKKQGKTVEIPVSEIGLQNVPRGYEVDFGDTESVELVVMGTSDELAELDTGQIAVSLDLSEYSRAGTYTGTLSVTLPDDVYSLMNDVEVEFELVRSSSTGGTGAGGSAGGNTGTPGGNSGSTGNSSGSDSDGDEDGDSSSGDSGTGGESGENGGSGTETE